MISWAKMARNPEQILSDIAEARVELVRSKLTKIVQEEHIRNLSRELARAEGKLVDTPDRLNPELMWELKIKPERGFGVVYNYKSAIGFKEVIVGETKFKASQEKAFHCGHCEGWVAGEPNHQKYDTLDGQRLAGSRGTKHVCTVCDQEMGRTVTMQS